MLPKELSNALPLVQKEGTLTNTVLALYACGFSPLAVSEQMGTSVATIQNIIRRYGEEIEPAPECRREFLERFLESRIGDAILLLTPEKMQKMKPAGLIAAIKSMGVALKDLKMVPKDAKSDVERLMEAMKEKQGA